MPENKRLPHLLVQNAVRTEEYRYPGGGGSAARFPTRNRAAHAEHLLTNLEQARLDAQRRKDEIRAQAGTAKKGVHLEIAGEPGFDLELKSLDSSSPKGIQLLTVREPAEADGATLATVYVPDESRLRGFKGKIRRYAEKDTKKGEPQHRKLVEKIADIRPARLRSFWTDRDDLYPAVDEAIWWEVWLRGPEANILHHFQEAVAHLGVRVGKRSLTFPSTRVLLAHGTPEQLSASIEAVDAIAELRRAKEVPTAFMEMARSDMGRWADGLRQRTEPPPREAPSICLLDTGVNVGHPLLRLAAEDADLHAVDPRWRVDDHDGHGTAMAGLALYGDLTEALLGEGLLQLPARIESVKILPPPPKSNHPTLYGEVTQQAVYRVEIEHPARRRTFAMAVTTAEGRERGRPSSWSAAVDQLTYGSEDEPKRLWILAAGNSRREARSVYPSHLETEEIHDPGQAWNALTVGACTDRWRIEERDFVGWEPVAPPGNLSPSSTTSATWQAAWPLKPDVVFEGGNSARSAAGEIDEPDSLSLLTTHHRPGERLFRTFGDTSAAVALVSQMAATLASRHPEFWPETIRALIVHSATWTQAMKDQYGPLKNKGDHQRLVRRCGFGVPSLERALWSANNRLTLVAQEELQPFLRKQSQTVFKELQIYTLPWPIQELRALGEVGVELRVTLSYFIEPNPSERGYQHRYRYPSHGFRFEVRSATETLEDFRKRLNKAARKEGERSPSTGDTSGWLLGSDRRHKGSLHSDIWQGTAADLANRQHVAVFPVSGWWKERQRLERWRRKGRYSLILTIHAPEVEVDLYTPVRAAIGIPIEI